MLYRLQAEQGRRSRLFTDSSGISLPSTELTSKPCSCRTPFAFDGSRRDSEDLGDLFDLESSEVTQFDDSALRWIETFEIVQCFAKSK